ncbi:DUF2834 domain-containing protein [Vallicoccus soli]|uniref:DUF2834 domain-containing protein n=1 Tax=Vallicoccus soli TaxID=2339232 RepID=UPI0014041AF2|nr:DUF2834 domain-containing protein [Vallicoccus soli]
MERARERTYLGLAVAGVVLPYRHGLPWLVEHGPDARLLARQLGSSRAGAFFGWDVVVSAAAVLALSALDDELPARQRAAVALATLAGPSAGLPLHLWLRERHRRRARRRP